MDTFKFKTKFAEDIFNSKYKHDGAETWPKLAKLLVNDVCGNRSMCAQPTTAPLMSKGDMEQLTKYITDMAFVPAGRYLYYAGRPVSFYNNCFLLKAEEDTREEWGNIVKRASDCLMSGGGIGIDYSVLRPSGKTLSRTGGISSGPLPLMSSVNEVGRNVMQGGSRRSAIYASLNWQHEDIKDFLYAKDWPQHIKDLKENDFNFPANFDMTNMSINWDTKFIEAVQAEKKIFERKDIDVLKNTSNLMYSAFPLWHDSVLQMCKTGEPGHSYNFWENENETLRNACGEAVSEDDSDVCNLGSINLANIRDIDELQSVVDLAAKFLVCGGIRGDLPYEKVKEVREKNRRIGLGLMGVHEWLLQRGYGYEVNDELQKWLGVYREASERAANEWSDKFFINRPKKYRAIAPAGSIGILASSTTGIEPMFAVAYKRRYLTSGTKWKYQYVIDATAQRIIDQYAVDPDKIETSSGLARDCERRIKFQYDVQKYVDMAISSTINLPAWGTKYNNETTAKELSNTILKYCHGLRGLTVYPDGSRGGQPLTEVPYAEAKNHSGVVFDEVEEGKCKGGICGI